ncbi:MAG: hypothetical protein CMI17_01155 [Opitutaceae bacterium]|nr:hypothetical protein [Opitutaceae bacterium]
MRLCFHSQVKSVADRLPLSDPPLRILTNPKISLSENELGQPDPCQSPKKSSINRIIASGYLNRSKTTLKLMQKTMIRKT